MNIQLNEEEPIYIKLPNSKIPYKQVSLFDCIKDNKLFSINENLDIYFDVDENGELIGIEILT
ncbi:hypothetical protein CRYPA_1486 [uncultured Candidatus Thioglobus sp.]|nr:hypothetical protein CRYPA_1486 [uncultured Candidatus Thioglobus sp.]